MNYRAFVSSTYKDLKDHRERVIEALLDAGIIVDPMERWTAATDEPKELSQARIIGCDLCILLVAFRRGHIPENSHLSITQMEYEKAMSEGCDILVFMLAADARWAEEYDQRGRDAYLLEWRSQLQEKKVVGFFNENPDSIDIQPALARWLQQKNVESSLLEGITEREILSRPLVEASPYMGLRRFEAEDADRFFGRDRWIEKLCTHLTERNLILLLGASGSGKSSMIRAGVIPKLRSQRLGKRFVELTFTPDEDPFESFYGALLGQGFKQSEAKLVRQGKPETLVQVARLLLQVQEEDYWLIFIDQFEELFTISRRNKRQPFVDGLVQLINAELTGVKIVLAMRADFGDRLTPYPELGQAIEGCNWFFTDMNPAERKEAIVRPAAQHGLLFETGLVQRISDDFAKKGSLPLLQYALNQVWHKDDISDRVLNARTYLDLGGLEGALQKQADKIYEELGEEEQAAAESIFTALVDVQGETPVSRRVERERFTDDGVRERTLDKLIDSRLLASGTNYSLGKVGDTTVEVAHETLLTAWPQLREWIEAKAETIVLRNRLEDDAAIWMELRDRGKTHAAEELWSGSKLERVLELRKQGMLTELSKKVDYFLEASTDAKNWLQRQKELQNQRELRRAQLSSLVFAFIAFAFGAIAILVLRSTHQARIGNIRTLLALSEQDSELRNVDSFQALLSSLKAARELRRPLVFSDETLEIQLSSVLNQAFNEFSAIIPIFHQRDVTSVIFSKDGDYIATGSDDKIARLWTSNGELIEEFEGHDEAVTSVAFSPDDQFILTGSSDNTARLWSRDGGVIQEFIGHNEAVTSVDFSPDGKFIATASEDNNVRVWQLNGELEQEINGTPDRSTPLLSETCPLEHKQHSSYITSVNFSPDGEYLATASRDDTAILWRVDGGEWIQTFCGHQSDVTSVSFSPNGELLATSSWDNTARIWTLSGELVQEFIGHQEPINSVVFSPDGEYLATASRDQTARVWSINGNLVHELSGHQDDVPSVAFSPDGKYIATASLDNVGRLWSLSRELVSEISGHEGTIYGLSLGSFDNEEFIVTASKDQTARIWRWNGDLYQQLHGHQRDVTSVSFSSDGEYIATASFDSTVRVWKRNSGEVSGFHELNEFRINDSSNSSSNSGFLSVSFSPNGDYIATGSDDNMARLWTIDGVELELFEGHERPVKSVAFSPDGEYLATASEDNTAILWTLDGNVVTRFKGHSDDVISVTFSPDGEYIITSSKDHTAMLWKLNGEAVQEIPAQEFVGHHDTVTSVSFSPDGQSIATGSWDNLVRIWSINGELLHELRGHRGYVNQVMFSSRGDAIVTASHDNTIRIWTISSIRELLDRGCDRVRPYLEAGTFTDEYGPELCEGIGSAN